MEVAFISAVVEVNFVVATAVDIVLDVDIDKIPDVELDGDANWMIAIVIS